MTLVSGLTPSHSHRPAPLRGRFRRALRRTIHFLSYHWILSRSRSGRTQAAGFDLVVHPTVFHPRFFLSSECFERFIDVLDLKGKCVADIGTGSGILALAAARAGAHWVVACDINPFAALTAAENARANGLAHQVTALCSNLLSAVTPRPLFDIIFSSPPKHAGEPRDLADAAWHAGERFRLVAGLFEQCRERLKPDGKIFIMVSSDSDFSVLGRLITDAGFEARLAYERSIVIESFLVFQLTLSESRGSPPAQAHMAKTGWV